ncbi:BON domain-containing protein [Pedosphaera parvula]|uniref:Transport-associated protein n=1 Tax=Pedosphaera parvula (strain Ellin514) TaxID=320771 RepID=B9XBD2_PEDPL|nr:BON domain-containing protein [Pedosphaera parvula]EEF62817.1 transport-associated protein [Pedosphaera parvula Ellin514]
MYNTKKIMGLMMCAGALAFTAGVTGCAGDRYNQSTGEHIDDRATTTRVKSALSHDATYKYENVNVTTFKGVVQLSGFTDTGAQKSRAGDIAKGVEGVREVKNNITVK